MLIIMKILMGLFGACISILVMFHYGVTKISEIGLSTETLITIACMAVYFASILYIFQQQEK